MSKKVPSKSLALDPSYLVNNNPNKKSYSSSKDIPTGNINNIQMVSSKPKSKCTVSRFLCIQLLILLLLLTLAAIIIPIIVIVLDTTGKQCATTYSQSFVYNTVPTTQCSAWQTFTSSLTCTQYKIMRIYGSNDPTGITLTDTYMVTALAIALRYNGSISILSNGVTWRVGSCSWSVPNEITSGASICNNYNAYTIRPCAIYAGYWGGILSQSYYGPTQTMSLYFE